MPLSNKRRKPRPLKHAGLQEFILFARAASNVAVGSEKPTASERCCVETINSTREEAAKRLETTKA
jgi:hypothetical protein